MSFGFVRGNTNPARPHRDRSPFALANQGETKSAQAPADHQRSQLAVPGGTESDRSRRHHRSLRCGRTAGEGKQMRRRSDRCGHRQRRKRENFRRVIHCRHRRNKERELPLRQPRDDTLRFRLMLPGVDLLVRVRIHPQPQHCRQQQQLQPPGHPMGQANVIGRDVHFSGNNGIILTATRGNTTGLSASELQQGCSPHKPASPRGRSINLCAPCLLAITGNLAEITRLGCFWHAGQTPKNCNS